MKKLVLIGGIGLVIVVILVIWAFIAGVGLVLKKLPHWMSAAEKVAGVAIEKAKEALPGIQEKAQEKAKEVSPEIAERIKGIIPGEEIPEKDVGGEDIAGIPRFPNMVRGTLEGIFIPFYSRKDTGTGLGEWLLSKK